MRVRAIITSERGIALIERRRDGQHYHVLPGGGVEGDETPEEALRREVREELGLLVAVGPLVAEIRRADGRQRVYRARVVGGIFGTGDGDEMTGTRPAERGTYAPVWVPLEHLPGLRLYPAGLTPVVAAIVRGDALAMPVTIGDEPA
jgi:8-oxo-dGTP diphosphatase